MPPETNFTLKRALFAQVCSVPVRTNERITHCNNT